MTASEVELLRAEVATLTQLLDVHEEQARKQFEIIRAQRKGLEERARSLDELNGRLVKGAAFLAELYRTMPTLLIICDSSGIIESANDATSAILGYSEPELVGMPLVDVLADRTWLSAERFARHSVVRAEQALIAKSGARIPTLLYAAVSEAADRRLVCVGLDIRDRLRLELELRQAQKLESIGRLAAGVAHEINTPVQFITDSLQFLREATAELIDIVDKTQPALTAVIAGAPALGAANLARTAQADVDLPYLIEHIPKAFARSLDGLGRVATIVRSMKEFAQPETKAMTAVDINRAVAATLVIAQNEYKLVADVETDFADLPAVECYGGDLNQAVLNIVVNAAHAVADRVATTGVRGRIGVTTRHDGERVTIAITDSGGGIPLDVRDRIFDPFFTTKEVGRGTGQGLAISRSVVVDRHGGDLRFESELGVGTTFYLTIPIHPASDRAVAAQAAR